MQTDRSNASVLVGGALLIAVGLLSLAGQRQSGVRVMKAGLILLIAPVGSARRKVDRPI